MTTTTTPSWTKAAAALIPPRVLALGNVYRTTLDLTGKVGARLVCCVARSGVTGITGNFFIRVRPMFLADTLSTPAGDSYMGGSTTAAVVATHQNATQATGTTAFTFTGTPTNFASNDAILTFWGHTQPSTLTEGVTANMEWVQLASRSTTGSVVNIDAPSAVARIGSEHCINLSEVWGPLWLAGGQKYEIIFDYANCTAGQVLGIAAYYSTYDSDSST